ncbi:MAG: sulfatase [Thermoanaerobaculales bacterium]|jgi:arylsulfatase A-like enzyme|nr:sulfatase [Thermoanaerobaculales bacterium]
MRAGAPLDSATRRRLTGVLALGLWVTTSPVSAAHDPPKAVVIVTIDALRADRLSAYGYDRPTSPAVDALLGAGLRFEWARTVEPLTSPAMASMITGIEPHRHGATRNGLAIRDELESLPAIMADAGWTTAAFVSNWTLKDSLTGLGAHFDTYGEVFTRRRWFGLLNSEATADDVTAEALDWVEDHLRSPAAPPFLLWVHYVEPHAPYRFHPEVAPRLGITDKDPTRSDRYDTEVAAVDRAVGELLTGLEARVPSDRMIVVFAADHGESLGEHDYWGHGRNLYEPNLRIPLGLRWAGRVAPRVIDRQATILDIAPTILELLGLPIPEGFAGASWAAAALGGEPPAERILCYQAHKGAVHGEHDADRRRSKGLLWVGVVDGQRKELLQIKGSAHELFDLARDPRETAASSLDDPPPSPELLTCLGTVSEGLGALDRLAAHRLDDETVEQLKALGYLE